MRKYKFRFVSYKSEQHRCSMLFHINICFFLSRRNEKLYDWFEIGQTTWNMNPWIRDDFPFQFIEITESFTNGCCWFTKYNRSKHYFVYLFCFFCFFQPIWIWTLTCWCRCIHECLSIYHHFAKPKLCLVCIRFQSFCLSSILQWGTWMSFTVSIFWKVR